MAAKKACVLHTPGKKVEAEEVGARLQAGGYEVCITGVSSQTAKTVEAGNISSLPSTVTACLDGAAICVILVDDEGSLGTVGGIASDSGCRVITVGGSPDVLPQALDDVVDGHVPYPDSPELIDVVEGEDARVMPDGNREPARKPQRVKCQ